MAFWRIAGRDECADSGDFVVIVEVPDDLGITAVRSLGATYLRQCNRDDLADSFRGVVRITPEECNGFKIIHADVDTNAD